MFKSKKAFFVWGASALGLLILLGGAAFWPSGWSVAQSSASRELTGYAWSSNIGWISFTPSDSGGEKVIISSSGDFSGYAWSENVGWINFGTGSDDPVTGRDGPDLDRTGVDRSGRPTSGSPATSSSGGPNSGVILAKNGSVTGWARACTVFASGCSGPLKSDSKLGAWDGWIAMSGSWGNGVKLAGNDFSGYAWGADNLGWVDFAGVTIVSETASPLTVACSITREADEADAYAGTLNASVSGGTGPYDFTWEVEASAPDNVIVENQNEQSTVWRAPFSHFGTDQNFTVTAYLTVIDSKDQFVDRKDCGSVTINHDGGGNEVTLSLNQPPIIRIEDHRLVWATTTPPLSIRHDGTVPVEVCLTSIESINNPEVSLDDAATESNSGNPLPWCRFRSPGGAMTDPVECSSSSSAKTTIAAGQSNNFWIIIRKKLSAIKANSPYRVTFQACGAHTSDPVSATFSYNPTGVFEE